MAGGEVMVAPVVIHHPDSEIVKCTITPKTQAVEFHFEFAGLFCSCYRWSCLISR